MFCLVPSLPLVVLKKSSSGQRVAWMELEALEVFIEYKMASLISLAERCAHLATAGPTQHSKFDPLSTFQLERGPVNTRSCLSECCEGANHLSYGIIIQSILISIHYRPLSSMA